MAKKKEEVVRNFRYGFKCEHCGNESGWLDVNITGKSEAEINDKKLPEYKTGIKNGNYVSYLPLNAGKCKTCNQRQSWELGKMSSVFKTSGYIGILIGFVAALIPTYMLTVGIIWSVVGFIGGFILGFLIGFIISFSNYNKIKANIAKTNNKFLPEIDWGE